jgi:transposase-like protein
MSVSYVARRAGVAPSLLFDWRRRMPEGALQAVQADVDVVGTSRVRELERRARELRACTTLEWKPQYDDWAMFAGADCTCFP